MCVPMCAIQTAVHGVCSGHGCCGGVAGCPAAECASPCVCSGGLATGWWVDDTQGAHCAVCKHNWGPAGDCTQQVKLFLYRCKKAVQSGERATFIGRIRP
eukprot:gene9068-biopygen8230